MQKRVIVFFWLFCSFIQGRALAQTAPDNCENTEEIQGFWQQVLASEELMQPRVEELAKALLPCLASTDSGLRDEIGYGLYTRWLRNGQLTGAARQELLDTLHADLQLTGTEDSLQQSFSALILSELLRADSLQSFMSGEQLNALLDSAVAAMAAENDFRGYQEGVGWVHPVAHLSDMLWRFALHPALEPEQAAKVLVAVRSKVAISEHAYIFNEADRLARPAAILIRRELPSVAELEAWLDSFQQPISVARWEDSFGSAAGLAELHNTKAFVRALSDQLGTAEIDPRIRAKLDQLVTLFTGLV